MLAQLPDFAEMSCLEIRLHNVLQEFNIRPRRTESNVLRKVLLPVVSIFVLALACGGAAWADTIDDPLHGQCNGTAPSGTCSDNGTNTPLGNSTTFGFTISPGPQTGDLRIDILLPNTFAAPVGGFAIDFAGTSTLAGTATLFSATPWTSGFLASYLGISASPSNPFGAYSGTLGPGATGFLVFQADLGTMTIPGNSGASTAAGLFTLPAGLSNDDGAYIVAFCGTGCSNSPGYVATANSGALLVTPEPGSLTMLFAGLLGLALLTGWRVLTA